MALLPSTESDAAYLAAIRRLHASYAMVAPSLHSPRTSPTFTPVSQTLQDKVAAHPEWFQMVYFSPADHVQVYRVIVPPD
jgi:hypothetical protein